MRDQTGYYRTTALPTPPSDAGTSERETPCRHCHRTLAEHEIGHAYCHAQGELPVSHPEFDQEYEPAAPAAEGPRPEPCEWCKGTEETRRDCAKTCSHVFAAALPGAEAGTPTLVDGYGATFWRDSYRMLANAVDLHLGDCIHGDDVAEEAIYEDAIVQAGRRLAALTSEVRARNEKLAEALVRAEKAEAELGVLRKHLGRVSPTKLLKSNIDRFWKNVEKTETCWLWIGTLDKGGYGRQFVGSRSIKAHRYSWELHVAPIPAGLHVLHNCPGGDNRRCVNPAHLWLGTLADNNADMVLKGRGGSRTAWPKGATECRNGHPLTAESIVILPDGARRCRICRLARQRQYTKRRAIRDAIDAARLASPSPTGAPSSPANPQEDETDAR